MWILLNLILTLFFLFPLVFFISLVSGFFVLKYYDKKQCPYIRITGNVSFTLLCHVFYLLSLIIGPLVLFKTEMLKGYIFFYIVIIILFILNGYLIKKQMKNIEEIICFLIFPAIIKVKHNLIIDLLRPFSKKNIIIKLCIYICILFILVIIWDIIKKIL